MNQNELSGLMEAMLKEKREGRMTRDEQFIFFANQVADNLWWNKPIHILPIQDSLLGYARRRIDRKCERDPDMHRRIALLIMEMRETHAENNLRLSQLHWAIEKLTAVNLTNQVEKLLGAIKTFVVHEPPTDQQLLLIKALEVDSSAKAAGL